MEQYDVVVIGGGLGSLTTAAYLSKRLRNVAVFEEGKQRKLAKYTSRIKDDLNNKYVFKFFHHDLGGVNKGDLFYEYMKRCGIEAKFSYFSNDYAMVIDQKKRIIKRPNDFVEFRTYLVRRYPKLREAIHALFDDIKRHYEDYRLQKIARLKNEEHTISSLLIEWGDLDLYAVLSKYFSEKEIINEFTLVYDAVGHRVEEINAYNYFIKFFDTFIDGSHFVKTSFNNVVKGFTSEISKTRDKIFTNRKAERFIMEDGKISHIIDSEGNEVYAKHFVINMRIDEFIDEYADDYEEQKKDFKLLYKNIHNETFVNQLYIGLDSPSETLGIAEKQYIFSEFEEDVVRLCSVINYKAIDPESCEDGKGALLVEFIDDKTPRKQMQTQVIDQLCTYFPGLIDHISVAKIGTKQLFFSGKEDEKYWENKTVNDKFNIDDYSAVNPFTNAYFIGSWLRPEAGITGMIQAGVEYGDIIDDLIYRGDDEDYFIGHEELMAIISNQFIPGALGKEEKNIQFFVGKDSYYIRTKAKHLRVYKGVSEISDIIVIATNECLYDLSVGNITLDKAIQNGSLEYVGDRNFLDEVIEAFDMGIEAHKVTTYRYRSGRWGILSAGAVFSVLLLSNLLANYHPYMIIAPSTIGLLLVVGYIKYRLLKYVSVFEMVSVGLYSLLLAASILYEEVNTFEDSRYTTAFFALYLLMSWLINKPVIFGFIKYDYRSDYTRTKLFKKMASGLTFIWGFVFLIISGMNFAYPSTYSSLAYYLVVLGIYLMYYYPTTYIKGNIVK